MAAGEIVVGGVILDTPCLQSGAPIAVPLDPGAASKSDAVAVAGMMGAVLYVVDAAPPDVVFVDGVEDSE